MNSFEGNTLLEGIISVKAAIEGKKRTVNKVYVDLDKRKQRDRKIMAFVFQDLLMKATHLIMPCIWSQQNAVKKIHTIVQIITRIIRVVYLYIV